MSVWSQGRGLLGPMQPLLGEWVSLPTDQTASMPVRCERTFRLLGKEWMELRAIWRMGERGDYQEIALYGATAEGGLGFFSFTSDGKRSEGRLADGSDIHPKALAFEAQMPAGLARMTYWPLADGERGFNFAVESRTKKGWNRFLEQRFRPLS